MQSFLKFNEKTMKTKLKVIFATLTVALLFISVSKAKPSVQEESFNVSSGGTLAMDSDSGSIEIESHNKNTVEVTVKKKGKYIDDFEVSFAQDGNDVKVTGDKLKNNFNWGGSSYIKYIVKIPQQYNVDLRTGGGSIELSDLVGKVDAYTSGGSISLGRISGDVEVKTSGGSIKVDDVAGNINAHTSGGSIKAKISKQPTQDCRLTTSGGSVKAYLSPSIAVDLNASTSGGSVSSEIAVKGSMKRSRIKGTINGGGPELYLRTSGGSVSVKEL